METIICACCRKVVEITPQQRRKKYCDECKPMAYKEVQEAYRRDPDVKKRIKETDALYRKRKQKEREPAVYTCKMCGNEFPHKYKGRPTYCMKCLEESRYVQPFRTYWLRRKQDDADLIKR